MPVERRTNRVFKSLHKPLTYLGVERSLFFMVCVTAVGCFNLFNSVLAAAAPCRSAPIHSRQRFGTDRSSAI